MADTYTQLYIQIIFAVEGRVSLIRSEFREELNKYITGIVSNKKNKLIGINGVADHMHLLIGLNPAYGLSKLVQEIKSNSSRFINEKGWVYPKFAWQKGYGAFSYGRSQLNDVAHYIKNQEEHHKKMTFKAEYIIMLKKFEVEYNSEYLFEWLE